MSEVIAFAYGARVRGSDGLEGNVIRAEDCCWERTRNRKTVTTCADPVEGHVLVRLDQPVHTIRDYWYRPDDLEVQS